MRAIWLKNYPQGMPAEITPPPYESIVELFTQSCKQYAAKTAYSNRGCHLSFAELKVKAYAFAAYLQNALQLKKGERIAIMLPNILQYPVAMFGAFCAGLTVVNINPFYTPRELIYQLTDSGAKAVVVLSNFAHSLQVALPKTAVKHVIVTHLGDLFTWPQSLLSNIIVKYIKRLVPAWEIAHAVNFKQALKWGAQQTFEPIKLSGDEIAYLQATGGTTGEPKLAMLLHRNMVASVEQISLWIGKHFGANDIIATPLPLYHIFSLCANSLMMLKLGGHSLLITNPRDIADVIRQLKKYRPTWMTGVNTLYNALLNHPQFKQIDFATFRFNFAGGMALQSAVAAKWHHVTGHYICEGYGLTETSPVVAANPIPSLKFSNSIGLPLPSTLIALLDQAGEPVAEGEAGELCVKGPQVMAGYWRNQTGTANAFTKDGWLRTGDIAKRNELGYYHIVDRKKNMISVSGLKVYPNEVEDVVRSLPGVMEVAVIGVPDLHSMEAVKAFVVRANLALSEQAIKNHCYDKLAAYKRPKYIEFCAALPKNSLGKILHRNLKKR